MLGQARGTKVSIQEEVQKKNWIREKLSKWAEKIGFSEIDLPTFEYSKLFTGGRENILEKEIFFLEGKEYALKPEGTASVARYVNSEKLIFKSNLPLKFFYFTQCFRYERPQKGRFREFTQFGLEIIKASSCAHEIELIYELDTFFKKELNLNLRLRVNYLSNSVTKKKWSKRLEEYFSSNIKLLSTTSRERVNSNPIRILDDKRDSEKDLISNSPKISELLSSEEREREEIIKESLKKIGIEFSWDPHLVRGLDYYTGIVFEWSHNNQAIAGGGRYDEFFKRFKPKNSQDDNVPSLGVAIGVERLLIALEESSFKWPEFKTQKVYLCNLLKEIDSKLIFLIKKLRNAGLIVEINWDLWELKSHFKFSEKLGIKWLLIYGAEEQKKREISLKEQHKNFKINFSLDDAESLIRELETIYWYSN